MDTALIFGSAFLIGLTGAAMPGPMLSVTLERTARFGWFAGPFVALGHSLLELVLVIAIVFGFGQLLTSQIFTGIVGTLGGVVLVWMGLGVVRDAPKVSLPKTGQSDTQAALHPWSTVPPSTALFGITTSITNPYWLLWWGTVGAGYVSLTLQDIGFSGVIAFYLGHISADFAWFTLMAYLMAKGGHFLSQTTFTWILRFLGVFLILFAGYFIWTGIESFVAL